jgi:hypothetical protein
VSGPSESERREQASASYHAIGRHIVKFSLLIGNMRERVVDKLSGGLGDAGEPRAPIELVLTEATAGPIANAFFGLCRHIGHFGDGEEAVASKLQNGVTKAIEYRNHIAHGDWFVGILDPTEDYSPTSAIAHLHPMSKKGEYEKLIVIPSPELEKRTDALVALTNLVIEFGFLALDLGVGVHERHQEGQYRVTWGSLGVSGGTRYRVRDALVVEGSGENAKVVRGGPKADILLPWNLLVH